jgi:hypothetical protein
MYCLTEAFRSTYLLPEELDRRPTSMGKAIAITEILVINEQNQPCKPAGAPWSDFIHGLLRPAGVDGKGIETPSVQSARNWGR